MRFKDRSFDDQASKASMWKERSTEPCFVQLKKLRPRDSFVSLGIVTVSLSVVNLRI